MPITPIWTAHCDECAYWDDGVMAGSLVEAKKRAKSRGWLLAAGVVLCPECRAAIVTQ